MDAGKIKQSARTTIFHQLLTPNVTEGHVIPTVNDLKDEAYNLVAAASETVGGALTTATYQVVSNKDIYSQLTAELKEAFPDPSIKLDFLTLEKLPYLVCVNPQGMSVLFF
jgi:hypothetical protein